MTLLEDHEVALMRGLAADLAKLVDRLGGLAAKLSGRPRLTGVRAGVRVASRMVLMAARQLEEAITFGRKA
jgi:hypothetical protein